MYIKYFMSYLLSVSYKEPILAAKEIIHYFLMNRLLGKKYNITIRFGENNFLMPNEHQAFYTLHEVFTRDLYTKLQWCHHVLDLWWFIGDTWVRLAQHNQSVSIYEPNISNFQFLEKNTLRYNNIKVYNWAVVGDKSKDKLYYEGWDFNASGKVVNYKTDKKIKTYMIADILWIETYDWLKMDIEWWEYDIINYCIKNNIFPFKKGYIEFHHYQDAIKIKIIDGFIEYLYGKSYTIEFEDVEGWAIYYEDINNINPKVFILYFESCE